MSSGSSACYNVSKVHVPHRNVCNFIKATKAGNKGCLAITIEAEHTERSHIFCRKNVLAPNVFLYSIYTYCTCYVCVRECMRDCVVAAAWLLCACVHACMRTYASEGAFKRVNVCNVVSF